MHGKNKLEWLLLLLIIRLIIIIIIIITTTTTWADAATQPLTDSPSLLVNSLSSTSAACEASSQLEYRCNFGLNSSSVSYIKYSTSLGNGRSAVHTGLFFFSQKYRCSDKQTTSLISFSTLTKYWRHENLSHSNSWQKHASSN